MLSKVRSAAVTGIDAYPVEVEVNPGSGDTQIMIVGNNSPEDISLSGCLDRNAPPAPASRRGKPKKPLKRQA